MCLCDGNNMGDEGDTRIISRSIAQYDLNIDAAAEMNHRDAGDERRREEIIMLRSNILFNVMQRNYKATE